VGADLEPVDPPVAVAVEPAEEGGGVRLELAAIQHAVVVGVGAIEPRVERSAPATPKPKRLAARTDEHAPAHMRLRRRMRRARQDDGEPQDGEGHWRSVPVPGTATLPPSHGGNPPPVLRP